jgi:hypothetical protein
MTAARIERRPLPGIGRSEQREPGRPHGRDDVHDAGVVGEHQIETGENGGHPADRLAANQHVRNP